MPSGEPSPGLVDGQLFSEGEFSPKLEPVLVLVLFGRRLGVLPENGEFVERGTGTSALIGVGAGTPVNSERCCCAIFMLFCAS